MPHAATTSLVIILTIRPSIPTAATGAPSVRGKMHVGFIAIRNIEANEQFLYDYRVRGLEWMRKTSLAASPKKKKTCSTSFEAYRRRRYCPVPGCPMRKPLKKLPNHLQQMHPSLTKEEKARMLKVAKYQAPGARTSAAPCPNTEEHLFLFNEEGKGHKGKYVPGRKDTKAPRAKPTPSPPPPPTSQPATKPAPSPPPSTSQPATTKVADHSKQRGSTRKYPTFNVSSTPFLTSLLSHAGDRFGLAMNPVAAKELVADVNKYLRFAGEEELQVVHLCDTERVRQYLFKLEEDGIHSLGQLTKLNQISTVLSYACASCTWMEEQVKAKVADAKDLFSHWGKCLQREKKHTPQEQAAP